VIDLVLTCLVDGCRGRVVLSSHGHRLGAEFSGTCPSCGRLLQLRPVVTTTGRRHRRSGRRVGPVLDLRSASVAGPAPGVPR
jgi:hypothetical protein